MFTKVMFLSAAAFVCARADFQYQSTSRVTGGSLFQMMRFVPGASAAKEPEISTVAIHGNRMVHKSKRSASIVDLDKRTITTINFDKHTYSEMTFDQMKQMMEDVSSKMSGQSNVNMDASFKNTGIRKTINGMDAHQVIVTMSMNMTDPKTGQSGAMKMESEVWLSKDVPGAGELRDFSKRMAKELDWSPAGMGGLMNRPDLAKGMAKLIAEEGKLDGLPVEQVIRMGLGGLGGDGLPSGGQPEQAAPARPSVSDALGGALAGKLGGLGGFGRKKKQDAPAADTPAGDNSASGQSSGSLLETTMDSSGFSNNAVDPSLFAIPTGFKKVEPELAGRRGK